MKKRLVTLLLIAVTVSISCSVLAQKRVRIAYTVPMERVEETSYLQPCTMFGYGYLEAVKAVFYSDEK